MLCKKLVIFSVLFNSLAFYTNKILTSECSEYNKNFMQKNSFLFDNKEQRLARESIRGNRKDVEILLSQNCDVNAKKRREDANNYSESMSPLMLTARFNHLRVVKTLIGYRDQFDNSPEVDLQDYDGNTALMHVTDRCAHYDYRNRFFHDLDRRIINELYTDENGKNHLKCYNLVHEAKEQIEAEKKFYEWMKKENEWEKQKNSLMNKLNPSYTCPPFPERPEKLSMNLQENSEIDIRTLSNNDLEDYTDMLEAHSSKFEDCSDKLKILLRKMNFSPPSPHCLIVQKSLFRFKSAKKIIPFLLNVGVDHTIKNSNNETFKCLLINNFNKILTSNEFSERYKSICKNILIELLEESKNSVQNRWNIIALMFYNNNMPKDLIKMFFSFCIDEKNDDLGIDKEGYLN